jgi:hypothetical protein
VSVSFSQLPYAKDQLKAQHNINYDHNAPGDERKL